MGTGIFKFQNGKKVELTNRQVKAYIMKVNGLTAEQYKKKYDIFKNKLRAYETFESRKVNIKKQSPVQILYKQAKAIASAKAKGEKYTPSIKLQRIQQFQSVSSGKAGKRLLQKESYIEKVNAQYTEKTRAQFKGFIRDNPKAQEIFDKITDPVQREKALADYANKLNAKIDEQDKVKSPDTIIAGERIGSDTEIDFDIEAYL
ncbi:MAG: hypothetical protein MJ060_02790 [Clostridia bacterium]|nr:hypothetical protein [Clostridia bacterium]